MLAWSVLLAGLTCVMFVFHEHPVSFELLGGASVGTAIIGAGLLLAGSRRAPDSDPDVERPLTDLSLASACTGIGVALVAVSARLGVFLTAVGGGLILLGLGGIARELRVERRLAQRRPR
jgi:hypothetical protein